MFSKAYIYKQGNFSVPLLDLKIKIKALLGAKGQAYTQPTSWQCLHLEQRDTKINFFNEKDGEKPSRSCRGYLIKEIDKPKSGQSV